MSDPGAALLLRNARLPRWLLPADWPGQGGVPGLADIALADGRVQSVLPARPGAAGAGGAAETWDLAGALALPGLVDAHLHLDKTFTLPRLGAVEPGLLGAIDAMMRDKAGWTPDDVRRVHTAGLQLLHALVDLFPESDLVKLLQYRLVEALADTVGLR